MKSTFKNLLLGTLLLCGIASLFSCTKEVTSIRLNETELSLFEGDMFLLKATVEPEDASNKDVVWTSGNEHVASVREQIGLVTAISEGETVITASCGAVKASCRVIVSQKKVTSISLDQESALVFIGESFQLTATPIPEDAVDNAVIWSSSNTDIASVDQGMVSPLSAGTATITATAGECSASCIVNVLAPYGGMCLESIDGGTITISNPNMLPIEYKVEKEDWVSNNSQSISIVVYGKKRVWFRGNNMSYTTGNVNVGLRETTFKCRGDFYLYGNLMSLIYGDEFESKTEITGAYAFSKLFDQNSGIINHPTLDIELPATTLSPSCYRNMFYQCSKLTRAPKLPAKILTEACYASMFAYCSSLKEFPGMAATDMAYMSCTWMMMQTGIEEAPELPAMNLADHCYEFMFMECPNLKKAMPILPATKLAQFCYTGMFQRADNLEDAPELPATKMEYHCYSHMFNGCKALQTAPKLPAMSLAGSCYQRMFGKSGLTEAPELPAMNMESMCYQYMFEGCKSLTKAPVLPAIQLDAWCYENMFHDCPNLSYIKADFLTHPSDYYTTNWVDGVAATGTFVKNPNAAWDVWGPNGIPEGWTVVYE